MKIIKINAESPEKEKIETALDVLRNGGTVVYPTDTVYGVGANIYQENAVKDVYNMKERTFDKPVSICLSKTEDIEKIAYVDQSVGAIIRKILPGPYTLILNKKEKIPSSITAETGKIGVRIPDNTICREISQEFPITTTSANISGHPAPKSAPEAINELNNHPDIILDSGPCKGGISSTVVDLTVTPPQILREGAGMGKLLQIIS